MIISETEFLNIVKKNTKIKNEDLLIKAYNFAKEAHKDQKRNSGDPYFVHPLDIAISASEYKLDDSSIAAALLHDTVEDTSVTLNDIKKHFGKEVAFLVDGLTKIENTKLVSRTEKNIENFRKLILATAKDIRILIIKLLDVLNNMKTIEGMHNKERMDRFSNETLIIYVPLAERIGMYKLKLELEDLCFKELFPKEREEILRNVKKATKNQKNIIDDILKKLRLKLTFENKINCKIFGRKKRPYSIWKKMQKKSISFEKLKDIIAFRIIVKNLQDCYKVLGCINSSYIMVPNTFKDYINKPKLNGYQSIHLVIVGPKNVKVEIQIRTEEMNRIAEYGVASHWMYKQDIQKENNLQEYNVLRQLIQNLESTNYEVENFEDLKYQIYEDEIFCYTPKGDIINLPIGSTGIDFAYAIHRDIGNRCCGVKINGILAQLKTQLNSGDDVEILTAKTVQIKEEWLNFVKTAKAKTEIKSFLRSLRQEEFEKIGRADIKALSEKIKEPITDELIKRNLGKFNQGKSVEDIYSLVAQGKIKEREIINVLFPHIKNEELKKILLQKDKALKIKINSVPQDKMGINGLDKNMAYKYAKCCYPIPPDQIVGVINSGVGITVHKKDCKTLKNITNERIIDLEWSNDDKTKYAAKLIITLDNTPGILAKLTNLCAEKKINITNVSTLSNLEFYQKIELEIEIKNEAELENFKSAARSIKGIKDVI